MAGLITTAAAMAGLITIRCSDRWLRDPNRRDRYWACGVPFTEKEAQLGIDAFTPEEWARLRNDPFLEVIGLPEDDEDAGADAGADAKPPVSDTAPSGDGVTPGSEPGVTSDSWPIPPASEPTAPDGGEMVSDGGERAGDDASKIRDAISSLLPGDFTSSGKPEVGALREALRLAGVEMEINAKARDALWETHGPGDD